MNLGLISDAVSAWGEDHNEDEVVLDFEILTSKVRDITDVPIWKITQAHTFDELGQFEGEVLAVDYGGMSVASPYEARFEIDKVLKWADNHQNSLVILATPYTGKVMDEVLDNFDVSDQVYANGWGQKDNIIVLGYDWDDHLMEVRKAARSWLGLTS